MTGNFKMNKFNNCGLYIYLPYAALFRCKCSLLLVTNILQYFNTDRIWNAYKIYTSLLCNPYFFVMHIFKFKLQY
jgi:hypothetical protein